MAQSIEKMAANSRVAGQITIAEEEEEESERLQAESSENEPEQQDIATQNAAEITDEGRYRMYSEEEKRLSEVVKKYKQNRRRRVKAPEPRPEQQEVTPDAPQSPNEVTSRIDGDAAWDELISTDSTDLPVVRGPKLARFRPLADPLDIKFEEPLHEGHPFLNECRVYGRLKQANKENLTIDCYGYVMFSSAYLEGKGIDLGTASTSDPNSVRGSKPGIIHEGLPEEPVGHGSELIYALLKDLPPSDATTQRPTAIEVRTMAKDLLSLHKLGIFHASISHSSYVAGKLVDFSTAQTAPSPWLDGEYEGMNPARIGKDPAFSDQEDFDEKVVDYWNAHAENPTPDSQEETKGSKGRSKQTKVKRLARAFTPEHKMYRKLRGGADREFLANMRIGDGWSNPVNSKWWHLRPDGSLPTKSHVGKRKWLDDDAESIERQTDPGSGVQSPAKKLKRRNGGAT
ncbi:hypothetical protein KJ359_012630 [Pestalotiopsis sp. 9143b]|nr:hypothetical protein KJ359_012630 [Pestalotiopsis sp. 9143b]